MLEDLLCVIKYNIFLLKILDKYILFISFSRGGGAQQLMPLFFYFSLPTYMYYMYEYVFLFLCTETYTAFEDTKVCYVFLV
jgi:hypothetical protein